ATYVASSREYLAAKPDAGFLYTGGETVTVAGAGDDAGAPAFSMSLTAPSALATISIASDGGTLDAGTFNFKRGSPLVIGWSGGSGSAQLTLSNYPSSIRIQTLTCTVPAASGQMMIPGAMTAQLASSNLALLSVDAVTT